MKEISSKTIPLLIFLLLALILILFAPAQPQIDKKAPRCEAFLTKNLDRLIPCTSFSENNQIYLFAIWTGLEGEHEKKVLWIRPGGKVQETTRFNFKVPPKTVKQATMAWLGFKKNPFIIKSSKMKFNGQWKAQLYLDNKFLAEYPFSVTMTESAGTPTKGTTEEYLLTHQTKFKGRTPISQELKTVLNDHKIWIKFYGKKDSSSKAQTDHRGVNPKGTHPVVADLSGANLDGVNLAGANLSRANLSRASLRGAHLKGTNFNKANLRDANLSGANLEGANLEASNLSRANLSGAYLKGTNFNKANLWEANLSEANLWEANLSRAYLGEANLSNAIITRANLEGAYLGEANLSGAFFEPKVLPDVAAIAYAESLSLLKYINNQEAQIKLRKMFKEAGFYEQERKITYAIKHCETMKALAARYWNQVDIITLIDGIFSYIFFDLTTQWGMAPRRALLILLGLIPIFAIPYFISLTRSGVNGIWRKWSNDRIQTNLGTNEPIRLKVGWARGLALGLYFSLLSTFNIGWRELNVGNWIQRLQSNEYTLRGTGWVRSVSGVQALISVYLLAMWVLTYFGRLFE